MKNEIAVCLLKVNKNGTIRLVAKASVSTEGTYKLPFNHRLPSSDVLTARQ